MDIQNTGRGFAQFHREISEELELIHGIPGELAAGENGAVQVPFIKETTGTKEKRDFDLVVLSVGLGPPDRETPEMLGFIENQDGFFIPELEQGLFVAGAAAGPMSVAESRSLARGAAAQAIAWLKGRA